MVKTTDKVREFNLFYTGKVLTNQKLSPNFVMHSINYGIINETHKSD